MIKILFVENEILIREILKVLLRRMKGVKLVAEASTGAEAIQLILEKQPDIILLDLRLPTNIVDLEIIQECLHRLPDSKILVLTATHSNLLLSRLLALGIHGYMTKSGGRIELEQAIRVVHSGQHYISPSVAQQIMWKHIDLDKTKLLDSLSEREMEILLLLVQGKTYEEISKQLFISSKTVNTYRCHIFKKLGVSNEVSVAQLVIQHALTQQGAV